MRELRKVFLNESSISVQVDFKANPKLTITSGERRWLVWLDNETRNVVVAYGSTPPYELPEKNIPPQTTPQPVKKD